MSAASPNDTVLQVEVTAFNILSALGVLSLTLVVATAHFSSTVHRTGLWFRHIIAWIVFSASYLLLIGHQFGAEPPFGLCLVQAALIYAAPTFPTLSALCFVIDLYIGLSAVLHKKRNIRPALSRFLLVFPLIVYVLVFLEVLLAVQEPGVVTRNSSHLYCHITSSLPTRVSAYIVIATGLFIIPLEIWIAVTVSLTMFVRVALYTIMSLTGVGLSGTVLVNGSSPFWSLVLPTVPILAAITFGTQEDLMKCYVFWRESEPAPASSGVKEGTAAVDVAV